MSWYVVIWLIAQVMVLKVRICNWRAKVEADRDSLEVKMSCSVSRSKHTRKSPEDRHVEVSLEIDKGCDSLWATMTHCEESFWQQTKRVERWKVTRVAMTYN